MIDMVNQVRRLLQSPLFVDWKTMNSDAYLTHVFYMTDREPEVGYYDPQKDKITTFTMANTITQNPEQQVFKKEDAVKALDIEKVGVSSMRIIEHARGFQEEKFPKEQVVKEIIILQNIEEGHVYNVTFVTATMKMLNMKLSTETGDVLNHSMRSVMDLSK